MSDTDDPSRFRTTRWTQIETAGGDDSPERRAALTALLSRYLPALRSHLVRRLRLDRDTADEFLQEFVVRKVYNYNLFGKADRQRGKFRTLLLTALDNFVRNHLQRVKASTSIPEHIDPPSELSGAGMFFDIQWAREVVSQAMTSMEHECRAQGRLDVWGIFNGRLLGPILFGREPTPYDVLADEFGVGSPTQAANRLVTAKRIFERHLRATVGGYSPDAQIDEEIADLRRILCVAGDHQSEALP